MSNQGNGQPARYRVTLSATTKAEFGQLHMQTIEAGIGSRFVAAAREIVDRLRTDPLNFGEPQYRLPALRLLVCQGVIAPIVVDFAVHEDRPLVFIRGFKLLL